MEPHDTRPAPSMVSMALRYARMGMKVFPCKEGQKEPACTRGLLDATSDAGTIEWRWRENPNFNVAAMTGKRSGFWAVDIDGFDAEAEIRRLEAEHGEKIPPTVENLTPRPGRHLLFALPPGPEIRNSAGKIAPRVDARGRNGYILLPPSLHPSGARYEWSVDCTRDFAHAPGWLVDLARGDKTGAGAKASGANGKFLAPPNDWATQLAAGVNEPGRNDFIARLSGHLLRHHVDAHVVVELMLAFGAARCRPPLSEDEVTKIVNSIAAAELRKRQCKTT